MNTTTQTDTINAPCAACQVDTPNDRIAVEKFGWRCVCPKCHDAYVIEETTRRAFKLSDKAKEMEWGGKDEKVVEKVRVAMNLLFDESNQLEVKFRKKYNNESGRQYFITLKAMKQPSVIVMVDLLKKAPPVVEDLVYVEHKDYHRTTEVITSDKLDENFQPITANSCASGVGTAYKDDDEIIDF